MDLVRSGARPQRESREKHRRECYVVLEDGANQKEVEDTIVNMPNYFADFDTTVNFIDLETLQRDIQPRLHGGLVFRRARPERGTNKTYGSPCRLISIPKSHPV